MSITPYLYYQDVEAALAFLSRAFGFSPCGEAVRDEAGRLSHAAAQLGGDIVMMGWPGEDYRSPRELGQASFSLYVSVADVDGHFAIARGAGAKIIEEPTNTEFGDRRYGAEDPEGHQWFFAAPRS